MRDEAVIKGDNSVIEKMYHYCDKCDKKFTQLAALKNHQYKAHSSDESHQCQFCDYRGSFERLQRHARVHQDAKFQCSFCGKKLKSPEILLQHEREHTGEKPFICHICDSAFCSKKALTQHTRGVHKIAGPRGGKVGWHRKNKQNVSD